MGTLPPAASPEVTPPDVGVLHILSPKLHSLRARARSHRPNRWWRAALVVTIGGTFWVAAFLTVHRLLDTLKGTPEIGALLAGKILGTLLLAFASILLLSNLVTALSTFFLAKDLDMLVSAPIDWGKLYLAKLTETLVHSSWMVALVMVPILSAYGVVFDGGPFFPIAAIAALAPFFVMPGVIGSAVTLILVNVFPARRAKDLLTIFVLMTAAAVILFLRFVRPEQLSKPEGFQNLVEFVAGLKSPSHPLIPSEWAASAIMNWLNRVADPLPLALLWTTAGAFVVVGASLHRRLFPRGFSKAQEGSETKIQGVRDLSWVAKVLRFLPVVKREFLLKDLRIFFRDTTQWSQLILLGVLLVVYVFNIRALPLHTGERVPYMLVTMVVFLNQGLAGFVLAAIAARFIFPSVSLEGRQLWLLKSSPLDLRAMLWSKYWVGTGPLLVVALLITIVTNNILQASTFMMMLSVTTTVCFTLAAGALAISLGVLYPQFDTENAAQIPTSFGGMVFMMSATVLLTLIILIEARVVTQHIMAYQAGRAPAAFNSAFWWTVAKVFALSAVASIVPLHYSRKRLEALEL